MMMIVINDWLMHQNFILAVFGQTTATSNGLTSPVKDPPELDRTGIHKMQETSAWNQVYTAVQGASETVAGRVLHSEVNLSVFRRLFE